MHVRISEIEICHIAVELLVKHHLDMGMRQRNVV